MDTGGGAAAGLAGSPDSPGGSKRALVDIALDSQEAGRAGSHLAQATGNRAQQQQHRHGHGHGHGHPRRRKKQLFRIPRPSGYSVALLAAIVGNVLEFYDFSIYAFFAPEIGKLFFPKGDPTLRMVQTFTVFAGGFLMRPVGSVLIGAIGDKYGTGAALKWSIALMTVPTVISGLLPTYHKAGIVAPIALAICRLVQGLSVGGELIGALLHTSDHSPGDHRGFYVGTVAVFGSMGSLLGSIVSVVMRHHLTKKQLLDWGWRVPFLTGAFLGLIGIFLRTQTDGLKQHQGEQAAEAGAQAQEQQRLQAATPSSQSLPSTAAAAASRRIEAANRAGAGSGNGSTSSLSDSGSDRGGDDGNGGGGGSSSSSSSLCEINQGTYDPDRALFDVDLLEEMIALEKAKAPGSLRGKGWLAVMKAAAGADKLRFLHVVCMACLQSSTFYLHFIWVGTYLSTLAPHKIPASQSFAVAAVMQAVLIVTAPFWGHMGDTFGGPKHRTVWILAAAASACLFPPLTFLLLRSGEVRDCFTFAILNGLVMGFQLGGNWTTWVLETMHDSPARVMTTSVAYNLGTIFGGAYPMIASALAKSDVFLAPVLPTTALGVLNVLVFSYARFAPNGCFNPARETERKRHLHLKLHEMSKVGGSFVGLTPRAAAAAASGKAQRQDEGKAEGGLELLGVGRNGSHIVATAEA